jgi:class 3 adenylate cyclase
VRLFDPKLPVIVITAPGPSLVEVKQWQQHTGSIDAIVEKPLRHSELEQALSTLVSTRRAEERSDRLARLMPAEAVRAADSAERTSMIEQAVLFTDLRRSTSLAVALGPSLLFERMNAALSTQAQVVRQCGGSVIKFTGDGLMATFRGSGKNHLALRCALALQPLSSAPSALPFGIGVASGLTITGFIGEAEQRHYDVIGATVHLAARLCALAGAGEVITTVQANLHAGVSQDRQKKMGPVTVRGFDTPIDCVAFTAVPPAVPG